MGWSIDWSSQSRKKTGRVRKGSKRQACRGSLYFGNYDSLFSKSFENRRDS